MKPRWRFAKPDSPGIWGYGLGVLEPYLWDAVVVPEAQLDPSNWPRGWYAKLMDWPEIEGPEESRTAGTRI